MRTLRKILSTGIYAVLLCIAAFVAYVFIGGYKLFVIETGSMEPDYPVGSVVLVKECDYSDLSVGDVITYDREGVVVTHRIAQISGEELVTKGDANKSPDIRPVHRMYVVGRVEKCLKGAGPVAVFLSNTYGKICIISLAVLAMLIEPASKKGKKNENKV